MEMWSAALFDHLKVVCFSPFEREPRVIPFSLFSKKAPRRGLEYRQPLYSRKGD